MKDLCFNTLQTVLFAFLLWGCGLSPVRDSVTELQQGCSSPGTIISADLPQPKQGYGYSYRVYLPPCFTTKSESRYPTLYLVPGRSSLPDAWFTAGLVDVVDRLILNREISPFIIVATENIESDPLAEIIYNELLPQIETQYPVINNRQYRAVAGGSLGGIAAYRLVFQHPDSFSSAGIFGAGAISGEENRINSWLMSMKADDRIRVFMDTGTEDPLMLERAEVLKSMLDDMGIENLLHSSQGGHTYTYWASNFEMYLKWLVKDWQN
ncbi:MAG: alpha/beta hydrolase-fold protein [Chloroflexota bacterium]